MKSMKLATGFILVSGDLIKNSKSVKDEMRVRVRGKRKTANVPGEGQSIPKFKSKSSVKNCAEGRHETFAQW